MNAAVPLDADALLASLRALQAQVVAIGYPNRDDLVGRELDMIDRSLRRLLKELGDRDSVDA
ncbi:hypothetical protein [Simplicispira suum]|uniref:Uncharacterized protein n=1 Tax=Simplicispira suum TaxID=2109915 RepID=A0A2S0MYQ2_9BURK|nr:hypothetical protein [Simplicispira suum]AVO41009.1 hypothetical protein C6571_06665 [Simplicispira suum]